MLDWELNRAGVSVPRWNGCLLASRTDPVREARGWAERFGPLVRGVRSIFVLGIGGGFHIRELAKQNPRKKIVAVDFVEELVLKYRESADRDVQSVYVERPHDLFEIEAVREALTGSFVVGRHSPSIKCAPQFYADVDRLLIGRDPQAFYSQVQSRPDDLGLFGKISFQPVRTRGLVDAHDRKPVSINQISQSIRKKGGPFDDRAMVWLLLSELVK
ncbi:MAG: hypothetical protein ABL958_03940 [Bdellovibrionia bacterium]